MVTAGGGLSNSIAKGGSGFSGAAGSGAVTFGFIDVGNATTYNVKTSHSTEGKNGSRTAVSPEINVTSITCNGITIKANSGTNSGLNYHGIGGSAEPIGGNVVYSVKGNDGFASNAWDANVTTIPADKVSIYSDLKIYRSLSFSVVNGKHKSSEAWVYGYSYGRGDSYSAPSRTMGATGGPGTSGCVFVYFIY